MKLEHQTKSGHMMMAMNKWSVGYLAVALAFTGEGLEFLGFIQRHPAVLWELATFSVASALGQFFIFLCVSDFGPLPAPSSPPQGSSSLSLHRSSSSATASSPGNGWELL
eukprot:TRINITY_DN12277_c0_g1_i1.p1 TRINITY_DN12277_c0_g1~~TRINITY_DN12277_c0_g1_i1.p1  ORF type:complete len:110 (-),score=34.79 TRINITY_DN12277_c0_g1_i1:303-632(-)